MFCPHARPRRRETGNFARNGEPDQTADGCSTGLQPLDVDAEALRVRNDQTMGGESLLFGLPACENRSGRHTRPCQCDWCQLRKIGRRVQEPASRLSNHQCERAFELFFNRLLRFPFPTRFNSKPSGTARRQTAFSVHNEPFRESKSSTTGKFLKFFPFI